MLNTGDIKLITAELTVRRKGTTRVQFFYDSNIIVWQESTRWTRNFTRSFSQSEQVRLLTALDNSEFTKWEKFYPSRESVEGTEDYVKLWSLVVNMTDGNVYSSRGKDICPRGFADFITIVSDICRQLFTVMD